MLEMSRTQEFVAAESVRGRQARPAALPLDLAAPSAAERPTTSSHSCSIGFSRATASGGWAATSAASSRAACSVPAAGATRLTRPSRSASSAPTVREESSRYLAVARPQRVTRRAGPTGTPRAAPGKRIRRLEPPTRMSQATAISAPPPTTSPWQTAIVGFGKATTGRRGRRRAACGGPCPRRRAPRATSAPAERPRWSAELKTSTRTASSPRATARCSSSSSSIWVLIALRACGRSRRITATPCSSTE